MERHLDMAKKKNPVRYLSESKWYHGTTLEGWHNICDKGIICNYNQGHELDFGYGFYLTPIQKQAERFITTLLEIRQSQDDLLSEMDTLFTMDAENISNVGVNIEFEFVPNDWLTQKQFNHKLLNQYDDKFAEFVFFNRTVNADGLNQHDYDFIFGVMSDSNPIRDISLYNQGEIDEETVLESFKKQTSAKQLSIHNQHLCDIIKPSRAYIIETGEELNVNDYNTSKSKKRILDEPAS